MRAMRALLAAAAMALAAPAFGASCSVSGGALAFGNYAAGSSWHVDSEGTLTILCTGVTGEVVVYSISLSAGGGSRGLNPRGLRSGANEVQYNVFTDSARTRVWGDGSGGTFIQSGSASIMAGPSQQNIPAFGRVFGGQSVVPGSYTDSLVITLSF